MTSSVPGGAPTRRRVLVGMGAALAVPAALALPTTASAATTAAAATAAADPAPECLASLVQEGELSYGDLMAG